MAFGDSYQDWKNKRGAGPRAELDWSHAKLSPVGGAARGARGALGGIGNRATTRGALGGAGALGVGALGGGALGKALGAFGGGVAGLSRGTGTAGPNGRGGALNRGGPLSTFDHMSGQMNRRPEEEEEEELFNKVPVGSNVEGSPGYGTVLKPPGQGEPGYWGGGEQAPAAGGGGDYQPYQDPSGRPENPFAWGRGTGESFDEHGNKIMTEDPGVWEGGGGDQAPAAPAQPAPLSPEGFNDYFTEKGWMDSPEAPEGGSEYDVEPFDVEAPQAPAPQTPQAPQAPAPQAPQSPELYGGSGQGGPIPEGMMLRGAQTMEFRDSNGNGIEDRNEGIYLPRDYREKPDNYGQPGGWGSYGGGPQAPQAPQGPQGPQGPGGGSRDFNRWPNYFQGY